MPSRALQRADRGTPMLKPTTMTELGGARARDRPGWQSRWSASATGGRTCCACSATTRTSRSAGSATSIASGWRRYRRRYPARASPHAFERVLDDPDVDAVIIATPVHTHYDLARRRSRRASTCSSRSRSRRRARWPTISRSWPRERDRTLMCGHTFLYSPPVRAVKRMIEAGTLGDIYFVSSSRVNLGLHQRDVSVIWDLGPHDFSILLYWLSELPTSVRAVGRDSIVTGIADVAFVTMTFASGIIANVELSWLAPSKLRRTVLVGSERMVIYDDGAQRAGHVCSTAASSTGTRRPSASTTCPTAAATSSRRRSSPTSRSGWSSATSSARSARTTGWNTTPRSPRASCASSRRRIARCAAGARGGARAGGCDRAAADGLERGAGVRRGVAPSSPA